MCGEQGAGIGAHRVEPSVPERDLLWQWLLGRSASACYERFVKPVRWRLPAPEGCPIE